MKVAIPKERRAHERRVAASPDTIKKFKQLGLDVVVETGAGEHASIPDQVFVDAGATIAPDEAAALGDADIVLKVQRPLTEAEGGPDEVALMKPGAMLVAATNADAAGDGYAGQLAGLAQAAGVRHERLLPDGGRNDWNDALKARRPR